jgi:hypothetical protein
MADQAEEQGQSVVQSFSSDLETGIKVRNHAQDINDRVVNRRIKFIPPLPAMLSALSDRFTRGPNHD